MKKGVGWHVMENHLRASDRDVGADVIGLGYVLNIPPVRPSRKNDGTIAA